jgi:hypothetical protein
MPPVSAEHLIALEAAVSELGDLYTTARGFVPLKDDAERALLPRVMELGRRLRHLLRGSRLTEGAVDEAAREIAELRAEWRARLDNLRASPLYRRAAETIAADRQQELPERLPQLLSGLRVVDPAPSLYFPVAVSSGRRRPQTSPFLSVRALTERTIAHLDQGLQPNTKGGDGWDSDLPSLPCAADPEALDSPVSLLLQAEDVRCSVFERTESFDLLLFTPHLKAPMSVVLAAEATDAWWDTHEESYTEFRDQLASELRQHDCPFQVHHG